MEKRFGLLAVVACIALGIGLVGGYVEGKAISSSTLDSINRALYPIEEKGTSYTFVHPLLAYRIPEAVLFGDYVSLKDSIQSIIDSEISAGHASRVSVYFRDLDAGRWIGISQNDNYYPASLLKVPAMIAYYKEAEENPSILSQNISYDPSVIPHEPFIDTSVLVAGKDYSTQNLINYMIIDSDNGAAFTLLARINQDFLHAVYTSLGIGDPGDDSAKYQISVRTYGLFFRVLYNATYLSSEYSERALKLLAETTFKNGIVAGVSPKTVVAHKYGEHVIAKGVVATGVELSDCGIVYYPTHPYLLCVMTSAKDVPTASTIIAKISRVAYSAVAERYATTTRPSSP